MGRDGSVHDRADLAAPGRLRQAQKQRTRDSLLTAAFALVDRSGLAGVSLREVAREAGIVPTAFYRHFEDMAGLGQALAARSAQVLVGAVRDAVAGGLTDAGGAVERYARHVRAERPAFAFLVRERFTGTPHVRAEVDAEVAALTNELVVALARVPTLAAHGPGDLDALADLVVLALLGLTAEVVDAGDDARRQARALARAERQLRLLLRER